MLDRNSFSGPLADVTADAGYDADHPPRMGFFTDTSVCIGCKACEVACKQWNSVPDDGFDLLGMSYDNTGALGADTWRHVAFIEQPRRCGDRDSGVDPVGPTGTGVMHELAARAHEDSPPVGAAPQSLGMPSFSKPGDGTGAEARTDFRWLMSSDVCKHCTHAGCLDVCPTGALFRTEFGTVVVQQDICNGCGYCVSGCPYGVIDRRIGEGTGSGMAQKCTLCYDRLRDGLEPACAKACPTDSIQFGPVDELRERADARLATLQGLGVEQARLYGHDPDDGVGGNGAFFLLLDEPEVYGLPPDPVVPTRDAGAMWKRAALAAGAFALAGLASFVGGRR